MVRAYLTLLAGLCALLLTPLCAYAVDYYTRLAGPSNWTANNVWSTVGCGGTSAGGADPGGGDTATICAGHTIRLDANRTVLGVTVQNGGTLQFGNNNTPRTLTIGGNLTIDGGGTLNVNTASNATHVLNVGGDIVNSGTFNLATDANSLCNVTFNRNGNQTVSGAGAYTFNRITLNMGATRANILDMQSNMTAPANFLTITNGTYKHSNTSAITPWTAAVTIPANGGFWLNGGSATSGNFNVSVTGLFRISAGAMTVGTANTNRLLLNNAAAALIQIDGGALNVSGGIASATATSAGTFTQSGGTVTLATVLGGTAETFMLGSATTFNMSGGSLVLQTANSAADDLNIRSGTQNVTGGTVQMGNPSLTGTNNFLITNTTGAALNIWNLVLNSTGSPTTQIGTTLNVLNDVTIQSGATLLDNNLTTAFPINIGAGNNTGNWTNDGTFSTLAAGTGTVTFTGTSATQAIGGTSATTFNNLTINKSAGDVAINTTPTVGNGTGTDTLTLTQGRFVTGANRVILQTNATVATPGATSYIVGTLQKNYAAGAALNFFAGGNDFPVGDSANYTPLNITAGTTTTAGNLTVSTTATDHPQVTTPIASTTIDAAKSVNRYWTVTASGITLGTAADATFTTIGGTPVDLDAGVTPGNFIVQRYDGTNWNPTTLSGTPTSTSTSITGLAGFGDFAIGETLSGVTASPGRFNAFETSTPAGAILGKIQTRVASTSTTLAIVAINAAKTGVNTAFTGAVTVTLLDSSNNGGALDANGCRPTWTSIAGTSTTTTFVAGDSGRRNLTFTPPANAYPDTRARIVDNATGLLIGCSTDRFALRPADLLLEALDADWQTAGTARLLHNTGATGGNVHAASTLAAATPRPFTLRATARDSGGVTTANYAGTPTLKSGSPACVLPAGCATGTLSVGAWSAASGVLSAPSHYSEAGTFNLEIEDLTFANVDLIDGSMAAQRTVPQAAPAPRQIGRFVPDRFILATNNAPAFKTFNTTDGACATPPSGPVRSFTYIGQPFGYATAPVALITAQNAGGGTTTNYRGSLWKLVGADVTENYSTSSVLDSSLKGTPTVAEISGTGTGIVTSSPSPADTVQFTRDPATPQAAFNANISLTVSVQDATENAVMGNGIIATGTSAIFDGGGTGIAFDSGNLFRYGRLKLANANGTPVLDLPLRLETQYWNGTTFVTHAADHCTILAVSNIALGAYQKNLNACETILSPAPTLTFRGGVALPKLTKPGSANNGSVDWTVNLGSTATGNTCLAVGGAESAATAANRPYLQGKWGGASYNQNPTARATFGVYKGASEFIYLRENY